jgi:alkyl hydroperoxide reductase subunit AhpF
MCAAVSLLAYAILSKAIPDTVTYEKIPVQATGYATADDLLKAGDQYLRDISAVSAKIENAEVRAKADKLGGTCCQAAIPPHKDGLAALIRTQTREMELAGVEVRLNTEATPELVAELNPYGVIVATGAKPIIPPIPGAKLPHVYTVEQAITGQVDLSGKKVAVIGGGVTGLETAHVLAEKSDVTVLEMSKFLAATVYGTVRLLLMDELKAAGVKVLNLQRVNEITETGVKVTDLKSGEDAVVDADAVVLSVGIRPEETVAEQFEAAFDHVALVGDAENAANIAEALRAAHGKAWVF